MLAERGAVVTGIDFSEYSIFEGSRKRVVYNWLQCYSKDSLKSEFGANGFKIKSLYSDVVGKAFDSESKEIAIVALKGE